MARQGKRKDVPESAEIGNDTNDVETIETEKKHISSNVQTARTIVN